MTDTEIWNDPWYRKLSTEAKIVWKFLLDRCDAAGFWKKDFEMATFQCGFEVNSTHFEGINKGKERVRDHGEYLEIVQFVQFQYGTLSEECKPHKAVITLLQNYRSKGFGKGLETLQEKDKDNDKEKDKEEGGAGEKPKSSVSYLEKLPTETLKAFALKYHVSPQGIQSKATELVLYCQSHGKRYKNYHAFLENALRKDIMKLRQEYPLRLPSPQQTPEKPLTDEERARGTEKLRSIGEMLKGRGAIAKKPPM